MLSFQEGKQNNNFDNVWSVKIILRLPANICIYVLDFFTFLNKRYDHILSITDIHKVPVS